VIHYVIAIAAAVCALAAPAAEARCSHSRYDACFKFSVRGEVRSQGRWTNNDCSGGATGSGTWSEVARYRTLRAGVLKVHRWHPRRLFTFEQPDSGSPPSAPARVDIERESSSASTSSCGERDPPGDCGTRSARYRQQIVPVGATRGLRLDFTDFTDFGSRLAYGSCYAQPPALASLSRRRNFPLSRLFTHRRRFVIGGAGKVGADSHDGQDLYMSGTVRWAVTLVRIR
jgi:hypothetical protein